MAWENIEERLLKPFKVVIPHEAGQISLPGGRLDIDEWLTSIAETDEELKELNVRRIRFLQNRWQIEKLLQLEWDAAISRRMVLAMYVHNRAYILTFDGLTFEVVGSLEPKNQPALYQALVDIVLHDSRFVPMPPKQIKNLRPDLVSNTEIEEFRHHHEALPHLDLPPFRRRSYLARLITGWVGNWLDVPVRGYWSDESEDDFEKKKAA